MKKQLISIEEVKAIDIVDYLFRLGYEPQKVKGSNYWYCSPLRDEKNPSFKVNRQLNRWYDHGLGKGGNIIDFGVLYHNRSVGEFLQNIGRGFSFQAPLASLENKENALSESKISILKERSITSFPLIQYLKQRCIPLGHANEFCKEVFYQLNGKNYYGIGSKNDSGGYEIRNPYFKASSSPKDITTIRNGAKETSVFEGFIDFLSFMVIHKNLSPITQDFVILNSVSFFEKARPFMEQHESIKLYLDRDTTGQNCSKHAMSLSDKYKDESSIYKNFKDLNEWLMNKSKAHRRIQRQKPG